MNVLVRLKSKPFSCFKQMGNWSVKQLAITASAVFFSVAPVRAQADPEQLTNLNGSLFFAATKSPFGRELWKSDGSQGGTVLVKDIAPGEAGSVPDNLTTVGTSVYFTANGSELWKSNGTETGTLLVKSFSSSLPDPLYGFTDVNGTLYFVLNKGNNAYEL
jgi:ELWxxDGT repeat protein